MSQVRHDPVGGADESAELIHRHPEGISSDELTDELADWLDSADQNHFDEERLDSLLKKFDDDGIEASLNVQDSLTTLHRNLESVFKSNEKNFAAASSQKNKKIKGTFQRILPIVATIGVILCIMTAQVFGFNIFGKIAQWTSEKFNFSEDTTVEASIGAHPLKNGEKKSYPTLQDALRAFKVRGKVAPTWVPKRFKQQEAVAYVSHAGTEFSADYYGNKKNSEFLSITIRENMKGDSFETEKDKSNAKIYSQYNIDHYIVSDKKFNKATWTKGNLECKIYGTISKRELEIMIQSIYHK